MHLDQKVTIFCTDRDTKSEGKIIRMNNFQNLKLVLREGT